MQDDRQQQEMIPFEYEFKCLIDDYNLDDSLYDSREVPECPFELCDFDLESTGLPQHKDMIDGKIKGKCNDCGQEIPLNDWQNHKKSCSSKEESLLKYFLEKFSKASHEKSIKRKLIEIENEYINSETRRVLVTNFNNNNNNTSECKNCRKEILVGELQSHQQFCGEFKCSIRGCSAVFDSLIRRNFHEQRSHESSPESTMRAPLSPTNMKRECINCGKKVQAKKLKQHERICTNNGEKNHKCSFANCPSRFKTLNEKNDHMWRVHRPPIPCPYKECNKMINPAKMTVHMNQAHQKEKPKCDICGKEVAYSYFHRHKKMCAAGNEK